MKASCSLKRIIIFRQVLYRFPANHQVSYIRETCTSDSCDSLD